MSKILLFSDLHCHMHKGSLARLNDCLAVLEWVFDTAVNNDIKTVVFAGDLFQDRQKIHTIAYEKVFQIIDKYCGITSKHKLNLFALLGNHDMWFHESWDICSLGPLVAIENVHIINKPGAVKITDDCTIDFLPYTKNPIEDVKLYFGKKKNKILVSHCSLDGAKLNAFYNTRAEISVEHEGDMVKVDAKTFTGWKRVFLGHYHCAQKINDYIEYIGSPLELNFGEAFQEKHIIIFDTDTYDTQYVINDFSPKHLIVPESQLSNFNLSGNFVKIVVDDITSTNIVDMRKSIKDRGFSTLEFEEKSKKKELLTEEEKQEVKKVDLSSGDILQNWIDARKPFIEENNLQVDFLLTTAQDLIRRANA